MKFNTGIEKTTVAKILKRKSEVIEIQNAPKNILDFVSTFIQKNKEKKELEKSLATLHSEISGFFAKRQDEDGFNNEFNNSYKISDLTYITKNVFKIVDREKVEEVFGEEVHNYFEEKLDVTLKQEVFENESLQKELMKLLGNDFPKYFETVSTLKPIENYNENIYTFAKNNEKLAEIRLIVEPSKATLK